MKQGLAILEFGGHGEGNEHSGISEGRGVKILMSPMLGYEYFLESPIP